MVKGRNSLVMAILPDCSNCWLTWQCGCLWEAWYELYAGVASNDLSRCTPEMARLLHSAAGQCYPTNQTRYESRPTRTRLTKQDQCAPARAHPMAAPSLHPTAGQCYHPNQTRCEFRPTRTRLTKPSMYAL